jgi:hypothetical protein
LPSRKAHLRQVSLYLSAHIVPADLVDADISDGKRYGLL